MTEYNADIMRDTKNNSNFKIERLQKRCDEILERCVKYKNKYHTAKTLLAKQIYEKKLKKNIKLFDFYVKIFDALERKKTN